MPAFAPGETASLGHLGIDKRVAEYIFLTDDSGIGNPHAEPHIPCYVVENLNQLLIRLIGSELAGERQYATEDRILRTVGNPVNGVCTATQPAGEQ